MDLNKHYEFFNPLAIEQSIHIIGCGAIGSNLATQLTRLGCSKIHLYDFDTVEEHNITNQAFMALQLKLLKTKALKQLLLNINPACDITLHDKGWVPDTPLSGYVFICTDSIESRKAIVLENQYNPLIEAFFDFRMRLTDAQHYAAKSTNIKQMTNLLTSMDFTHEEAKEATPLSACGTTLSVLPTIWQIVSLGVTNFINLIRKNELKFMILTDAFSYTVDAY